MTIRMMNIDKYAPDGEWRRTMEIRIYKENESNWWIQQKWELISNGKVELIQWRDIPLVSKCTYTETC